MSFRRWLPLVVFLANDRTTARVLKRVVEGRTLTFEAEDDRLRDRETGTLWDPLRGEAVSGALAGRRLDPVPFTAALWYAWSSQHPATQIAR